MHKLVIMIETLEDTQAFEAKWPEFLHLVEAMPGLRREASSHVEHFLFGKTPYMQMHELFFDTFAGMENALVSAAGQNAGRLLQEMTGGRMALFFAEHKEDDLDNIRKHRQD
jgi:uncharacterized protein (TIGR02118 family)